MTSRPFAILVALLLAGCSGSAAATPAPPTAPPSFAVSPSTAPTPTLAPSTPAPASPTPSPTLAPIPSAAPDGKLVVAYEEAAQVELIPPSGHRVLIDVWNPDILSRPPTADDILLTTHNHDDHYVQSFLDAFPGRKLTMQAGTIKAEGITITGIRGEHDADPVQSIPNYIYVVEIAGLRVVHFGDLGQDRFTAAQLKAIGAVDVAIAQLSNSFSSMSAANRKGVNLMNEVHPRVIIPTHLLEDPVATANMAAEAWSAQWTPKPWIELGPTDLPSATTIVFVGEEGTAYGKLTKAALSSW